MPSTSSTSWGRHSPTPSSSTSRTRRARGPSGPRRAVRPTIGTSSCRSGSEASGKSRARVERVYVERLEVRDLRNIREVSLELEPGLNVFVGRNAQGKTSLLEAVALLARGRSFRTERVQQIIRRGAAVSRARGVVVTPQRHPACLE